MSIELISVLIAVLAVGATLGGLILTGNRGLRQDIRQDMVRLEARLREDIKQLSERAWRGWSIAKPNSKGCWEGYARLLVDGSRPATPGPLKSMTAASGG